MNKAELGRVGECVAEAFLKQRGFSVWRPDEFIRLLELAVVYGVANGECKQEPKEPLTFSVPTEAGHVHVTYWRGRCIPQEGRAATPIEHSIYVTCLKKCVEESLGGQLLNALRPVALELLAHRKALKTVDLFAFKDGVVYAVEVKTNSGKLSETQWEKTLVLRLLRHLAVRVYLQNPLVEISQL